jgi:hypothetical protein
MIQMISDTRFELSKGGHKMTLSLESSSGWVMVTENACTRAWHGRVGSYTHFDTLSDVESRYKSWRGLGILVAAQADQRMRI